MCCFVLTKHTLIMEKRIKMDVVEPEGFKAMLAFEKYLGTTELTSKHKDLIKIRASQLNGCSYCINSHTKDARKAGETEQRIYSLTSWRETPFFTPEEQAVLALTEEVTLIAARLSDATYAHAVSILGEKYTAQVIMAVIGINSWNRIGVALNMIPDA
jgi:AhpD family alkylhydroperoxidase